MANELWETLLRFHDEVTVPHMWDALVRFHREVAKPEIVGEIRHELNDKIGSLRNEMLTNTDAIYRELHTLRSQHHALSAQAARIEEQMAVMSAKLDSRGARRRDVPSR